MEQQKLNQRDIRGVKMEFDKLTEEEFLQGLLELFSHNCEEGENDEL